MIKILVVDDEIELCDLIAYQLVEEGYEVCQAYSVNEALKKYKEHQPKIILSDMQMPGGTGVDLFTALKEISSPQSFHFFILSGFVSLTEKEILDLGIKGLIKKPMKFTDILTAIKGCKIELK